MPTKNPRLNVVLNADIYETIERIDLPPPVAGKVEEVYLRLVTEWLNKPWQSYSSLGQEL